MRVECLFQTIVRREEGKADAAFADPEHVTVAIDGVDELQGIVAWRRNSELGIQKLGQVAEARLALQKALAISPKSFDMFVRNRPTVVRPEDYEHMLDWLHKAG